MSDKIDGKTYFNHASIGPWVKFMI